MKKMKAEWDNPQKILIAYPAHHTDWDYIIEEARCQYDKLIESLLSGGEVLLVIAKEDFPKSLKEKIEKAGGRVLTDLEYNDTWTRDYGAITVEKNGELEELDFGFNGWGLKFASDKDNLVTIQMVQKGYREREKYRNNRDFTLEGGSIETDGKGLILTTSECLCSPNRNGGKNKEELETILKERLGADKVLWLDYGFLEGDDTDSHIDTLARLAPGNTIIYMAPPDDKKDIHFKQLSNMEKQLKGMKTPEGDFFNLIPLPFPDPIMDENGERLPATYANYLVTAKNLFIPTYGQPSKDLEAVKQISRAFPSHKIYTVDCTTLIKQHGSLHCSTMQLYY